MSEETDRAALEALIAEKGALSIVESGWIVDAIWAAGWRLTSPPVEITRVHKHYWSPSASGGQVCMACFETRPYRATEEKA